MSSAFVLCVLVTLLTYLFAISGGASDSRDWFTETCSQLAAWDRHANAQCSEVMPSLCHQGWSSLSNEQQLRGIECLMTHPLAQTKPALPTHLWHCDAALRNFSLHWWQHAASQQQRADLIECLQDRLLTHALGEHFFSDGDDDVSMVFWRRR